MLRPRARNQAVSAIITSSRPKLCKKIFALKSSAAKSKGLARLADKSVSVWPALPNQDSAGEIAQTHGLAPRPPIAGRAPEHTGQRRAAVEPVAMIGQPPQRMTIAVAAARLGAAAVAISALAGLVME